MIIIFDALSRKQFAGQHFEAYTYCSHIVRSNFGVSGTVQVVPD